MTKIGTVLLKPVVEPGKAQECLVDGIHFEVWREAGQDLHDAPAHIAVERVVAGPYDNAFALEHLAAQVPRRTHFHTKGLGLVRPGDDAAIVVRQDDDRLAAQARLEDPLARCVEVVAINEREYLGHAVRACG